MMCIDSVDGRRNHRTPLAKATVSREARLARELITTITTQPARPVVLVKALPSLPQVENVTFNQGGELEDQLQINIFNFVHIHSIWFIMATVKWV